MEIKKILGEVNQDMQQNCLACRYFQAGRCFVWRQADLSDNVLPLVALRTVLPAWVAASRCSQAIEAI